MPRGFRLIWHWLMLAFTVLPVTGHASIDQGYQWLAAQQIESGHFEPSLAQPQQATSETLTALSKQTTVSFGQAAAGAAVLADTTGSTESLARQILVVGKAGNYTTLLEDILKAQNSDGGFGSYPGYDSSILDTAFAILSMQSVSGPVANLEQATLYLVNQQQADGSFEAISRDISSFYITAVATLALESQRFTYALTGPIQNANQYLLNDLKNNPNHYEVWEKAYGLLAISAVNADVTQYQAIIGNLIDSQASNGSWSDDAYITALALQAISKLPASDPSGGSGGTGGGSTPPPALASNIGGSVIDSSTRQPLEGVLLTLTGTTTVSQQSSESGVFSFQNLAAGSYTLVVSSNGYNTRSINIDLQPSTSLGLGTIPLTQAVSSGIIKGTVTDGATQLPLAGARLDFDGSINTTVVTDQNGYYQVSGGSGSFTVTVSMIGYKPVSVSGPVVAGGITNFSPVLYPVDSPTPPNTLVSIGGVIKDAVTQQALQGVNVLEQTNGVSVITGSNGEFTLSNLTAGNLVLVFSKDGYSALSGALLAVEGAAINVGAIYLEPVVPQATSTLKGQVTDYSTHEPIAGASVSIDGLGLQAVTDLSGSYEITNIPNEPFNITISAIGYVTQHASAAIQGPSIVTGNYALVTASFASVVITEVEMEHGYSYEAFGDIDFEVILMNTGNVTASALLLLKILDGNGAVYSDFAELESHRGIDLENSFIQIVPGVPVTTEINWSVASAPPGMYQVVVQAFDRDFRVLSEKSVMLEILPTVKISGMVDFDPPVMQLSENRAVNMTARISNSGNLPVGEGTVTATVRLKNKGTSYANDIKASIFDNTHFTEGGPSGVDGSGNIYLVQPNAKTLKKITSGGVISTLSNALPANIRSMIVDVDQSGLIYLLGPSSYFTLDQNGLLRSFALTGRTGLTSFALTPSGRLFISAQREVFEVLADGSTSTVAGAGLADASGMVMADNGDLFIADEGANAIWKFSNGIITSYLAVASPSAIVRDSRGYFYVTSFSLNSLIEISPDKTQRVITNQLSGPKDLKLSASGDFVVANYNSSQIVRVSTSGVITLLYGPSINAPVSAKKTASGSVMALNSDGTLVSIAPDLSVNRIASGLLSPVDLYPSADGGAMVLHQNGARLARVSGSGVVTNIYTSTVASSAVISDLASGSLISNKTDGIATISASGVKSSWMERYFPSTRRLAYASDGSIYMLDLSGAITKVDSTKKTISFVNKNTGVSARQDSGFVLASDGSLYISDFSRKTIIKVSAAGAVSTVATLAFNPGPLAVGPGGLLLIAKAGSKEIYQLSAAGSATLYKTLVTESILNDLIYDPANDEIWASGSQKIMHVLSGGAEQVITPSAGAINDLLLMPDGSVIAACATRVIKILRDNTYATLLDSASLLSQNPLAIVMDGSNNYWVSGNTSTLMKFDPSFVLVDRFASLNDPDHMVWGLDGNLYVVDSNNLIRVNGTAVLSDLVAMGSGLEYVDAESSTSLLLANNSSVMRVDLTDNGLATLKTGFNGLNAVVALGDHWAAFDATQNTYREFTSAGATLRQFSGLVEPTAVAITADGTLFVGNSLRGAILKQGTTTQLEEWFVKNTIRNLRVLPNGNLQATTSNELIVLDASAQLLSSVQQTSIVDALENGSGQYLLSDTELLSNDSGTVSVLATGFSNISGLSSDPSGNLFATDMWSNAIIRIHVDGALEHLKTINTPDSLQIDRDSGLMIMAYSGNNVRVSNDADNEVTTDASQFKVAAISSLSWASPNLAYLVTNKGVIYKLDIVLDNNIGLEPGAVIYTATRNTPALGVGAFPVTVGLGSWQPPQDGDYEVELVSNTAGVGGVIRNTMHVGSLAKADFGLNQTQSLPGHVAMSSSLNITGVANNTITRLMADSTMQVADINALVNANNMPVADTMGNIYVGASNGGTLGHGIIKKYDTNGLASTFVTDIPIHGGLPLAIDNHNNLYVADISRRNTLLKVNPSGQWSDFVTMNGTIMDFASSYDGLIYVRTGASSTNPASIYKIDRDANITLLPTPGITLGTMMTLDKDANIYMASGISLIRVEADGQSASTFMDGIGFENEGHTMATDCAGNVIISPSNTPDDPKFREEDKLYQIMRDTREIQMLLYGPSVDASFFDMDNIYYDRFGDRLLIKSHTKTFGMIAKCGGLDTEVHLITRSDVDLSSAEPAPSAVITRPDGTLELVWYLEGADIHGVNIEANWLFKQMAEGEQRPVVAEAFMQFNNSFDPANPIRVPVTIPSLTAVSNMAIHPATDQTAYGPHEPVTITATVSNSNAGVFGGSVQFNVLTEQGGLIKSLPPLPITDLLANATVDVTASWDTASYLTGDYVIQAQLLDTDNLTIVSGMAYFSIGHDEGVETLLASHIASDKIAYTSRETVTLSGRVNNLSSNDVIPATTAQITVTAPDDAVIFSDTVAINPLYPKGIHELHESFDLAGALPGSYQVALVVTDAETHVVLGSSDYHFTVTQSGLNGSGLSGSVSASPAQVIKGQDVTCTESIRNQSSEDLASVSLQQVLVDMGTDTELGVLPFTLNLAANSQQLVSHTITTTTRSAGSYACLLQVEINNQWQTLGAAGFDVVLAPLNLAGAIQSTASSFENYDAVQLDYHVSNLASIQTQYPVLAKIKVTAADGSVVYETTVNIPALDALASFDGQLTFNLVDASVGAYQATITLVNGTTLKTVSSSATTFTVVDAPAKHLNGSVSASAATVHHGEAESCTYTTRNTSSITASTVSLEQRLLRFDATGAVTVESSTRVVILAPMQVDAFVQPIDTTALPFANYRCELYAMAGGETFTLGQAGFSVVQAPLLVTGTVTSASPEVEQGNAVVVNYSMSNLSTLATEQNATVVVQVKDTTGMVVAEQSFAMPVLQAEQTVTGQLSFDLADATAGSYTIELSILNEQGVSISGSQSSVAIVEKPSKYLSGSVTVSKSQALPGETLSCTYTLHNRSTISTITASVEERLVQVDADQPLGYRVISSTTAVKTMTPNTTDTQVEAVDTTGYTEGEYRCELYIAVNNEALEPASATFHLLLDNVQLELSYTSGDQGRLLVLLDAVDFHDSQDLTSIAQQKAWLEARLAAVGWSYTIVHNAQDFEREFHTGQYVVYALLSNRVSFSETFQLELVDAVHRGDGLLVSGALNRRNNTLEKALGVGVSGREEQADGVSLMAGILGSSAETFNSSHKLDMDRCVADTIATYINVRKGNGGKTPSACTDDEDIQAAMVAFDTEAGAVVYAGFDLLDEATAQSSADGVYARLLDWSLANVHPASIPHTGNKALPVLLQVTNAGVATSFRLTLTTEPADRIVAAQGWTQLPSGEWMLASSIAEDAVITLPVFYLQPGSSGETVLHVLLETTQDGSEWMEYQQSDIAVGDLP